MRYLKAFYLLIGVALLAAVIAEIEVAEVGAQIGRVGYGFWSSWAFISSPSASIP